MITEFDYKKAVQAINLLAKKEGGDIDKLKAIKLIYLADRYHLRKYGRPVLNDHYVAMKRGPVASTVKDIVELSDFLSEEEGEYAKKYLNREGYKVKSVESVDKDVFSDTDEEALLFAYKNFGQLNHWNLVQITHIFPEWKKFEQDLESGKKSREDMNYEDFFLNSDSKYDELFRSSGENLESSKAIFKDSQKLEALWG